MADLHRACEAGDADAVETLVEAGADASYFEGATGTSCLMLAARAGSERAVAALLRAGAPWNALDRAGRCAGEYALAEGHQVVVDAIVEHAARCELLLGAAGRNERMRMAGGAGGDDSGATAAVAPPTSAPAAGESAEYLARAVRYDGDRLLDEANDAVMMAWEAPLMRAHALALCGANADRRVLNIGFGLGIVDAEIQAAGCAAHMIVEAHPGVLARARADGWAAKPNVTLVEGRWQDVVRAERLGAFDAIFYDAYAEDYEDMRELHARLPELLAPGGLYSFFNGLCPDNLFFHGVICQVVQVRARACPRRGMPRARARARLSAARVCGASERRWPRARGAGGAGAARARVRVYPRAHQRRRGGVDGCGAQVLARARDVLPAHRAAAARHRGRGRVAPGRSWRGLRARVRPFPAQSGCRRLVACARRPSSWSSPFLSSKVQTPRQHSESHHRKKPEKVRRRGFGAAAAESGESDCSDADCVAPGWRSSFTTL